MWLITNFGFFSVDQKPDDPAAGTLTIRARVKRDLETLRDRYLQDMGPILTDADADYRFRAKAPRSAVAVAAALAIRDIDYANFKGSVAREQGPERCQIYGEAWKALHVLQEPETPHSDARKSVGATPVQPGTSYGGLLFDDSVRVLMRAPVVEFDHPHWTFPRGTPAEPDASAEEVALRQVREETGYHAEIIGRVPGTFREGTGHAVYFLMRPIGPRKTKPDPARTRSVRWLSLPNAKTLIDKTIDRVGRRRDFNVLEAAVTAYGQTRPASRARDPADLGGSEPPARRPADYNRFIRRLFRMVRELHHRGYELLRIEPGLSPSGMHWRLAIASATLFASNHGARLTHSALAMRPTDEPTLIARYTSPTAFDCFGWGDRFQDSPAELADRFERHFPQILEMSRGADPAYVHWFAEMLVHTEPTGLPMAYADWTLPRDVIEILGHPDRLSVAMPPPGLGEPRRGYPEPGTAADPPRSNPS
jgi:8-oxo-dGTP pyrophosphatase MutT (NUDIX family)